MPIHRVEVSEYECFHCGYKWVNRINGKDGNTPRYVSESGPSYSNDHTNTGAFKVIYRSGNVSVGAKRTSYSGKKSKELNKSASRNVASDNKESIEYYDKALEISLTMLMHWITTFSFF